MTPLDIESIERRATAAPSIIKIQPGQRLHDVLDERKRLRDAVAADCLALVGEVRRLRLENEQLKKDVRFVSDFSRDAVSGVGDTTGVISGTRKEHP